MEIYLTTGGVADYLKFSQETIQRWVQDNEIPFCRIKRQIRFRVSDIEKWVDDNGVMKAKENNGAEIEVTDGDFVFDDNSEVDVE